MARKFPLVKILRGKLLEIAEFQDEVILSLVSKFKGIVFHDGTAIWRIYGGKRFSFDVDFYFPQPAKIKEFLKREFNVIKAKLTPSEVLYARIRKDELEIELNVSPPFKKVKVIEEEFFLTSGDTIVVRTLSPESLVKEKVETFLKRKKARDLYDIFSLLDLVEAGKVKSQLRKLLPVSKPKDFDGLKSLILVGVLPSFETLKRKIERYAKA